MASKRLPPKKTFLQNLLSSQTTVVGYISCGGIFGGYEL